VVRARRARLWGEPPPPAAPAGPRTLPPEQQAAIRGMVDGLDARLQAGGGTPDEWLRLARSRAVLGERDRASAVLARARTALAGDPKGWALVEAGARDLGLDAGQGAGQGPGQALGQGLGQGAGRDPGQGASQAPAAPALPAPEARGGTETAMAAVRAMPQAERDAAIRGMVESLDRRLAAKGGSPDEWLRLVRSYSILGEREKAAGALDRARMALAANPEAVARLDGLARDLDLPAAKGRP
jgi:cytochrome c-type biogenesis protein CcmH